MISFEKTEFLLGEVRYGETKSVTTTVSNLSSQSVSLTPANSSCSCTTGRIQDSTLLPNAKTQFTISINTNKAGKGLNQTKSITLKYKIGTEQHSQIFRLKLNVI